MTSRKLNILQYAFTDKAEILRVVHQGSLSNRKVLYNASI